MNGIKVFGLVYVLIYSQSYGAWVALENISGDLVGNGLSSSGQFAFEAKDNSGRINTISPFSNSTQARPDSVGVIAQWSATGSSDLMFELALQNSNDGGPFAGSSMIHTSDEETLELKLTQGSFSSFNITFTYEHEVTSRDIFGNGAVGAVTNFFGLNGATVDMRYSGLNSEGGNLKFTNDFGAGSDSVYALYQPAMLSSADTIAFVDDVSSNFLGVFGEASADTKFGQRVKSQTFEVSDFTNYNINSKLTFTFDGFVSLESSSVPEPNLIFFPLLLSLVTLFKRERIN